MFVARPRAIARAQWLEPGRWQPLAEEWDHRGHLGLLIVDGYCDLDPDGRPGLGSHVHRSLGIPVIGVAKTAFHTATHAILVRRGTGTRRWRCFLISHPRKWM